MRAQVLLEVSVGNPAERGYYEDVDNGMESAIAYFKSIGFTEARWGARGQGEREGGRCRLGGGRGERWRVQVGR